MDVEQFKDDVREGRIDADRLVDLVVTLQRELQAAKRRIEELEKKLGGSPAEKVAEPFSVSAEEQRQRRPVRHSTGPRRLRPRHPAGQPSSKRVCGKGVAAILPQTPRKSAGTR